MVEDFSRMFLYFVYFILTKLNCKMRDTPYATIYKLLLVYHIFLFLKSNTIGKLYHHRFYIEFNLSLQNQFISDDYSVIL